MTYGFAEPIVPPAREGHRRKFSEADKRRIVEPGASLSEVARHYGIAARLLFRWKHGGGSFFEVESQRTVREVFPVFRFREQVPYAVGTVRGMLTAQRAHCGQFPFVTSPSTPIHNLISFVCVRVIMIMGKN